MNANEHLLICLMEECDEVSQRVSKALRFGLNEVQPGQPLTNAARIIQELNDLAAVRELLEQHGLLPIVYSYSAIQEKKAKLSKYFDYSKKCGTVTEDLKP